MKNVEREDVLELAVRADRCGQRNLAYNLYAVAGTTSRMSGFDSHFQLEGVASSAADGLRSADKLGVAFAAGMVS
jgi:hypothetical protein